MQARLRSDRIHAAAVAVLPYWENQFAKAKEALVDEENARVQILLGKKTVFGRAKHNEVTARNRIWCDIGGRGYFSDWSRPIDVAKRIVERLEKLVELTAINGKPFPMLLDEADYNKIWSEL